MARRSSHSAGIHGLFVTGRRLTRLLRINTEGSVEDIAISTALGVGVLHCALFAIGLASGYVWFVFVALLVIPMLLWFRELRALYQGLMRMNTAWAETELAQSWAWALLSASVALFLFMAAGYALTPSLYFDMVDLHLPAARHYAAQHALVAPAWLPYAYYPQSVETLMALGYDLGGQPAAQLLTAIYFAVTLLMLVRLGRLCGMDRLSATAGIAFGLSIPMLHWTASAGKNDFALAMFVLGALLGFLRWRDTHAWGWILTGAFFIAMAAGVKHIAVFAIPPLGVMYAYAAWQQPSRVRAITQLAGILLIFGLFWHVRTWMATGNPVYPSVSTTAIPGGAAEPHKSVIGDLAWRSIRFPWNLHFNGRRYYESVSDYPMGITLALFAPAWLLLWNRLNTAGAITLLFVATYLTYWGITIGMVRYALAPLALVYAFTAWQAVELARAGSSVVKWPVFAACCYALLFSVCGIAINELNGPQIRYFLRQIDGPEYLREALLPYRALEFVKAQVRAGDALLCVDACAAAYLPDSTELSCYQVSEESPWKGARAGWERGSYRFVVVPRVFAERAPSGWTRKYADESYTVLSR